MHLNSNNAQPRNSTSHQTGNRYHRPPNGLHQAESRYSNGILPGFGKNPLSMVWEVARARGYRVRLSEAAARYTESLNKALSGVGLSIEEDGTAWRKMDVLADDAEVLELVDSVDIDGIVEACAVEEVMRMAGSDGSRDRVEAAKSPLVSNEHLCRLAHDPDIQVVMNVAKNVRLSEQREIVYLSNHPHPSIRASIAASPYLRAKSVEKLSRDSESGVRSSVAGRKDLTPAQWKRLAHDDSEDVRLALMENGAVPDDVFDQYTRDSKAYVRGTAAQSARLTDKQVRRLSRDRSIRVRGMIASRSHLSPETLDRLRSDSNSGVRAIADMNHVLEYPHSPSSEARTAPSQPSVPVAAGVAQDAASD